MNRVSQEQFLDKVYDAFQQRYHKHLVVTPRVLRKTRRRLPILFKNLGFTSGAELGVRRADFSLYLCQQIPNLKITCVDPWGRYGGFRQEIQDGYYDDTCKRLAKYDSHILRMTSIEAIDHVKDRSLDFVYIDGDHHFDCCMLDLIYWSKKVKRGGIVSGHDYGNIPDVNKAVDAFTAAHNIHEWYLTREVCCTFFWRNP